MDEVLSSISPCFLNFSPPDAWQFTRLHEMILRSDSAERLEESIKGCSEIDAPDANGRTALWWAAARGNARAVLALLKCGADPNVGDCDRVTPLHAVISWAVDTDASLELVHLLFAHDTNAAATTVLGETPIHSAATRKMNQTELVERLLVPDVYVNSPDRLGRTPLWTASLHDNEKIGSWLLEHGADPELVDSEAARTPLFNAVSENSHSILDILLKKRANCRAVDSNKCTLLMYACRFGDLRTMTILSSHGVGALLDPLAQDCDGDNVFSEPWMPNCAWKRVNRNEMLRIIASGHCEDCTVDARRNVPAAEGGCPHGALEKMGLKDYIESLPEPEDYTLESDDYYYDSDEEEGEDDRNSEDSVNQIEESKTEEVWDNEEDEAEGQENVEEGGPGNVEVCIESYADVRTSVPAKNRQREGEVNNSLQSTISERAEESAVESDDEGESFFNALEEIETDSYQ